MVQAPRHELVAAAACLLISTSITPSQIDPEQTSVPHWRSLLDFALQSKNDAVQEAAAIAMAALSKIVNCSAIVER